MISRSPHYRRNELDQLFLDMDPPHLFPQLANPRRRQHRRHGFYPDIASELVMIGYDPELLLRTRVLYIDLEQEPVQLRLWQVISALLLDRVLRRHHHKRRIQQEGLPVDRNLPLFHHLEKGRLCLGRRPVDLVDQNNIAEYGPRFELKAAFPGIEHGSTDDVTGHQVRRKLDPRETNGYDPAEQFRRQRLGDTG